MKKVLITGITGQDGYFNKFLQNNFIVYGTTREADSKNFFNLKRLGVKNFDNITPLNLNILSFRSR